MLRYSPLYEWISKIRGTPYAKMMADDRAFYRKFITKNQIRTVFDVGANVGNKTEVMRKLVTQIVCIEADPQTSDVLKRRFASRHGVIISNVAVGSAVGTATMFRKSFSGFNTLSEKWSNSVDSQVKAVESIEVQVTTLDLLAEQFGTPDYIKIDVEGFELPAIQGLNKPVRAISFEANCPTFLNDTREILKRLQLLNTRFRYNLRILDASNFHLPEFVSEAELVECIEQLSPFTCDVFAVAASS